MFGIEESIERLCLLDERARRRAYFAVRHAGSPVTRADVAAEIGISLQLAAFHLDKLVHEGFLDVSFDRPDDFSGAGRPAKRYRPSDLHLEVTIPQRRYDIAATVLAAALATAPPTDRTTEAIADVAYGTGAVLARAAARKGVSRKGHLMASLTEIGYEPHEDEEQILLRNCPFFRAAEDTPDIVCPMNSAFVSGLLEGARVDTHVAVLDRRPGQCCVVLTPRAP